jgi:hypothetical protein
MSGIQFNRAIAARYIRIGLLQTTKTTVMKPFYFFLISLFFSLSSFCQAENFFVSASISGGFGGPTSAIRSDVSGSGYQKTVLGSGHAPSLILKAGMKINKFHSLYLLYGQYDQTSAAGSKIIGSINVWGVWTITNRERIKVNVKTIQYGAGYQFEFPKSRWKLGVGPSLLVMNYDVRKDENTVEASRQVKPGASFSARVPIGKGKKPFGVEFIADLTLAQPVTLVAEANWRRPMSASMTRGTFGIAFTYRHRNETN